MRFNKNLYQSAFLIAITLLFSTIINFIVNSNYINKSPDNNNKPIKSVIDSLPEIEVRGDIFEEQFVALDVPNEHLKIFDTLNIILNQEDLDSSSTKTAVDEFKSIQKQLDGNVKNKADYGKLTSYLELKKFKLYNKIQQNDSALYWLNIFLNDNRLDFYEKEREILNYKIHLEKLKESNAPIETIEFFENRLDTLEERKKKLLTKDRSNGFGSDQTMDFTYEYTFNSCEQPPGIFLLDSGLALDTIINYDFTNNLWHGTFGYRPIFSATGDVFKGIDEMPKYPASYDFGNVISVASIDTQAKINRFSNYHNQLVGLVAFSESIEGYGNKTDLKELNLGIASGTSITTFLLTQALALGNSKDTTKYFNQIWKYFDTIDYKIRTGKSINPKYDDKILKNDFCDTENLINQCHIDDWTALKALYASTNGDNWINRNGWEVMIANQMNPPEDCDLENLYGVSLDINGRVASLNLDRNNLSESISPELGKLSNLRYLHLCENQLSGSIPAGLGNLSNLRHLHLFKNQLSGSIPSELGNLSNLTYLYLEDNQLIGNIPSELVDLINLEELDLSNNLLTGNIPEFRSIPYLDLSCNNFNSGIPDNYGNKPLNKVALIEKTLTINSLHSYFNNKNENGKTYTLLIGIDDNKNVKDLNYSVNDINLLKETLENNYAETQKKLDLTMLKNKDATKQNILLTLNDIKEKVKPNDNVLMYFVGHGYCKNDKTINENIIANQLVSNTTSQYILPYGFSYQNKSSDLSIDEIKEIFNDLNILNPPLLIVDACRTIDGIENIELTKKEHNDNSKNSLVSNNLTKSKPPYESTDEISWRSPEEPIMNFSHDFTRYIPNDGSSSNSYLIINNEKREVGGAAVLDIEYINNAWKVTNSVNLDFSDVGGSSRNCSGAITPWGTVISSEEHYVRQNHLSNNKNDEGYFEFGWQIEMNPATKQVLGKVYTMCNFAHENATICPNQRIVYKGVKDSDTPIGISKNTPKAIKPKLIILNATSVGNQSVGLREINHGLFTYNLVKSLKKKSGVDLNNDQYISIRESIIDIDKGVQETKNKRDDINQQSDLYFYR